MLKTIYSAIPKVKLSPEGTFKYILIHVSLPDGQLAEFVRGDLALEYHAQNFEKFRKELAAARPTYDGHEIVEGQQGVKVSCPGGGRVKHSGSLD